MKLACLPMAGRLCFQLIGPNDTQRSRRLAQRRACCRPLVDICPSMTLRRVWIVTARLLATELPALRGVCFGPQSNCLLCAACPSVPAVRVLAVTVSEARPSQNQKLLGKLSKDSVYRR
jgi:hypothetical protein